MTRAVVTGFKELQEAVRELVSAKLALQKKRRGTRTKQVADDSDRKADSDATTLPYKAETAGPSDKPRRSPRLRGMQPTVSITVAELSGHDLDVEAERRQRKTDKNKKKREKKKLARQRKAEMGAPG